MAHDLSPILKIAREILQDAGLKGMHISDIAQAAVSASKNMGMPADEFQRKVQVAIAGNLKLKTAKPSFAPVNHDKGPRKGKPKQGWYRLKITKVVQPIEPGEVPQTSSQFLGKAGEYAVMSELLFWGFNASIMTVDDGIDIVASKDNKFFHIQVKTATRQENGKFSFSIKQSSFKRYNSTNVFYVFVLRGHLSNEYIIMPSGQINYFIASKVISEGQTLSLSMNVDTKKSEYWLNGTTNITPFYGRFGEIIT